MKFCMKAVRAVIALVFVTISPVVALAGADPTVTAGPDFVATAFAPSALAEVSLGALVDQAADAVPEWGSGKSGLGKRAGLLVSSHLMGASAAYSVAEIRGTTTAYVRCQCKGFPRRARHALVSEFIEHRLDGGITAPVARFAGLATSVAASAPLLPPRYGAGYAMERAEVRVGADIGINMLDEFWPEIRRTLGAPLRRFH